MTHVASPPVPGLLLHALAKHWWVLLLRGVCAILFGVLTFVWPGITLLTLVLLYGAYALADGVLALAEAVMGGAPAPRWWLALVGLLGIAVGILANAVAWIGYGTALWLLARGLLPAVDLRPGLAVAVFTASYLAGFLALFAPGGLGVREGLFILMLQGPLGIGAATALALASRLLLTITEFGAAVPFVVFSQRSARVAP